MQDFTHQLFIIANIPSKVFVKYIWRQNFTLKKILKALISILKRKGVCNLFPTFSFLKFFFLKIIINKSFFEQSYCWNSAGFGEGSANSLGSGRDLLTTWVGTEYCWAHGCTAPPLSFNNLSKLIEDFFLFN